jgi:hypothetical protein
MRFNLQVANIAMQLSPWLRSAFILEDIAISCKDNE